MARFRVAADGVIFTPASTQSYDRLQEYMLRFLEGNELLNSEIEDLYDCVHFSDISLEDRSDQAVFYLYLLAFFDFEINNGGIAQFYQNRDAIAPHTSSMFKFFGLDKISQEFQEIHSYVLGKWSLLEQHWESGSLSGPAVYEENSPERERWYQTWAAFRDAIEPVAGPFESRYYPQNTLVSEEKEIGGLCREIAEACCAFIEREPELFQIVTVN
jgi:Domain of unknown function (DUF4375)